MISMHDLTLAWLLAWWPGQNHGNLIKSLQTLEKEPYIAELKGLRRPAQKRSKEIGSPWNIGPQGLLVTASQQPETEKVEWVKDMRFPFGVAAGPTRMGDLQSLMDAARILLSEGEISQSRFQEIHRLAWTRQMHREMASAPELSAERSHERTYLLGALSSHLRGESSDIDELKRIIGGCQEMHLSVPRTEDIGLGVMRGIQSHTVQTLLNVAGLGGPEQQTLSPIIGNTPAWQKWLRSETQRFGTPEQTRKMLEHQPGNWILGPGALQFTSPAQALHYLQISEGFQGPLTPSSLKKRGMGIKDAALRQWPEIGFRPPSQRPYPRGKGQRGPRAPASDERLKAHFVQTGEQGNQLLEEVLRKAQAADIEVKVKAHAYEFRVGGVGVAALLARPRRLCLTGTRPLPPGQPDFPLPGDWFIKNCGRMSDYSAARWSVFITPQGTGQAEMILKLIHFAAEQTRAHDTLRRPAHTQAAKSRNPFPDDTPILPGAEGVA